MSLGDINFIYTEKIDNLNNRMARYDEIIKDYEKIDRIVVAKTRHSN